MTLAQRSDFLTIDEQSQNWVESAAIQLSGLEKIAVGGASVDAETLAAIDSLISDLERIAGRSSTR